MKQGWEYKKFETCINKTPKPKQVKTEDYNSGTKYPIVSQEDKLISGYYDDESYVFHIDSPVVIFGDHTRVLKYVDFDFVVGADGVKIISPKQDLNAKFLLYYLQWYKIPNLGYSRHYKLLKELNIPLPPKSTQLAIVSELDKINELIRLKKEQLKDFDNLAQSIFYEMFGDPVENEKGWEVKKLNDISQEIGDGLHGTPEYSDVDTGCFFINGNNLENGIIVIKDNTKTVSEKTKAKHYIEMDDFTILVSINGTLGKVAFYRGENVILGKSACYIKLTSYNDKKYIYELLKSEYFKRYAETECTGTTIRNVSLKSMRNFPIPLPPLPLQHLFAHRIEQIEHQKAEVQKAITDLETLLASRMQYWFE